MALTTEHKHHLLTQAMKDEAFRAALQRDARGTIAQELQLTLPPEVTLHVLPLPPRRSASYCRRIPRTGQQGCRWRPWSSA